MVFLYRTKHHAMPSHIIVRRHTLQVNATLTSFSMGEVWYLMPKT